VLPEKTPVFIRFFARFKKTFPLPLGADELSFPLLFSSLFLEGEDLSPSLRGLAGIA